MRQLWSRGPVDSFLDHSEAASSGQRLCPRATAPEIVQSETTTRADEPEQGFRSEYIAVFNRES